MERLIEDMGDNSPSNYDAIFLKRKERGVDAFDLKRWKKLLKYYRGGKLVDLGCLDSLVCPLALEGYPRAEVWGIDMAEDAIKSMRARYPNAYWQTGDVYDTKFPSNYFDYIVAGELIEHLDDPAKFMKEAFRILKHGGVFALSTPKGETHAGEVDHHNHLWSFLEEDIHKLLAPYSKKVIIKTMGSQFFPYYLYHFPNLIGYAFKA